MKNKESLNKKCSRCHSEKPIQEFYKNRSECKACAQIYIDSRKDIVREQKKIYYIENKTRIITNQNEYQRNNSEKVKQTKKKYRDNNKEKISAWHKRDREENRDEYNKSSREYYQKNRESKLAQNKRWSEKNPERVKELQKRWANENANELREYRRDWALKNKERISEKRRFRAKERIRTDLTHKNIVALRRGTCRALKYGSKPEGTLKLLGCSPEFFVGYIEDKFQEGMTWDNWSNGEGKWNLDHILPVSSFDFSKPESWKICFHYTNLQPLWWRENMDKFDKLDWEPKNKKD